MLLVVNINNTQTSFGVFKGEKLEFHWRLETRSSRTPDEYAALLFSLMRVAGLEATAFTGAAVSSVVPAADHFVELFLKSYLGLEPFKVTSQAKLGFGLNVDVPSEVGADRIANTAYAVKKLKLPACIVDIGTATTLDVVSKAKAFEGGAILPGLRMSVEALGTKTAKLPVIDLQMPRSVVGKNTIDCIRSGVFLGYCDLIDGLVQRLNAETGRPHTIVLTGGLAHLLHPHLKTPSRLLPSLTLEGVAFLYADNCA